MKHSFLSNLIILLILFSVTVFAQSAHNRPAGGNQDESMLDMPGMQHGSAHNQATTFIDEILHHFNIGDISTAKFDR